MGMRNLIPKEYWGIVRRKDYRHLDDLLYLVICDSCGEVFLKESFQQIRQEIADGLWDRPFRWYVTAGRHWLQNSGHMVRVYMVESVRRSLVCDLSAQWISGLREGMTKEALAGELDFLEEQAAR